MSVLGMGTVLNGIANAADELFTSDEERLKLALEEKRLQFDAVRSQLEVNREEAKHKSLFVAGWRPAIGWVGAMALAYQFLAYPLLVWLWTILQATGQIPAEYLPPPTLPADALWVVLSGMLGVAGMRSYDKLKSTDTRTMVK